MTSELALLEKISFSIPMQTYIFLPARASEQGNVIRSVRIYMCTKKIVIERTRDLIYLKFVATDFFLKIISLVELEELNTDHLTCGNTI